MLRVHMSAAGAVVIRGTREPVVSGSGRTGSYGCTDLTTCGAGSGFVPLRQAQGIQSRAAAKGENQRVKIQPVPNIAGAILFEPSPHTDERGFFSRTFDADVFRSAGLDPAAFVQDSVSRSIRGVIRGMHVRRGLGEAKLVRCSFGAVFDVIVDLRRASPTYGNWESFELTGETQASLYVPAGCAHGFQALTDPADVSYRIDRAHDPADDVAIAFDDPELAIPWPLPPTVISRRDQRALSLTAAANLLPSAGALAR